MTSALVNGSEWTGREGSTISDVVEAWCPSTKGVAVAVCGEVIPKSRWHETMVAAGDRIEIVTAAAGG